MMEFVIKKCHDNAMCPVQFYDDCIIKQSNKINLNRIDAFYGTFSNDTPQTDLLNSLNSLMDSKLGISESNISNLS